MSKEHRYESKLTWTGNKGRGTASYVAYGREFTVSVDGKPELLGSSDPAFRGDPTRYNPEDMLVASLSSCHMLWYLHLCAEAKVVVTNYTDSATGTMIEDENGGHFTEVILHPVVTVAEESMVELANELHHKAHELCFIANSVNFPVNINPSSRI